VLNAQKVHFIAIGGYGMSGLAMVLLQQGVRVSGSDVQASERTRQLMEAGAEVHIGAHDAAYIEGADLVIYSTQVPESNPELAAARAKGIRVWHRSELLAHFLNQPGAIALAGTHGKTTTTSMTALLLEQGGLDPTVLVGGELKVIGGTGKAGKGPVVAEADESDRSFLRYHPTITVVTNMEPEHLEHWNGSFEEIKKGFRQYLSQVVPGGLAILWGDDANLRQIGEELQGPAVVFYGEGEGNEWRAVNIRSAGTGVAYDVWKGGQCLGTIELPVPGRHNALNSLAALIVGDRVGLSFETMQAAFRQFGNAKRRFQIWAEVNDIVVVDDYAHHPTEVRATLAAAKERPGRRVVAVFQPQRYSRTHWLMKEFTEAFDDADELILTPIYSPPGEEPIPGVSSESLAAGIERQTGRPVKVMAHKQEILQYLLQTVRAGDTVLTMGAGDIWTVAKALAERLQATPV
jgi:UDP-N-acetylmuramate--alanine ligase